MELYHVSFKKYEVGKTYTASNPIGYHLRAIQKGEGWVNDILDEYRPDGTPSRISSFYACDILENCVAYIGNKTIEGKEPIYYKVKMECTIGFPMVMVDRIKCLGNDTSKILPYIDEYWNPTLDWKYLEFLSSTMTIIEILSEPFGLFKGKRNYEVDRDLAIKIFY